MAGFGPRAGRIQRAEQQHPQDAHPLARPGGLESAGADGHPEQGSEASWEVL